MGLKPAAHHRLLKALQEMAEGKIDRLAPGSAKSTFASILSPPWYVGHAPGDRLARSRNILAPSLGLVEVRSAAAVAAWSCDHPHHDAMARGRLGQPAAGRGGPDTWVGLWVRSRKYLKAK